jgi:hypothetical protein
MKTLIVLITKDTVPDAVLNAAKAQGEVLVNVLAPIKLHADAEKDRHMNCTRNRNEARKKALTHAADAYLFLDSDVLLPPDAVKKFDEANLPVAYGWYKTKQGINWVAGQNIQADVFCHYLHPVKEPVPVDLAGLGCMWCTREVLEKFEFFPDVENYIVTAGGQRVFKGECYDWAQKTKEYNPRMIDVVCQHLDFSAFYRIPEALFEGVMKYLSQRPVVEVHLLFNHLTQMKKETI